MSSTSTGRPSGREKLAELKAQEAREARQKKMLGLVAAVVAGILVAVGVMWVVSNNSKSDSDKQATAGAQNTSFISQLTSIPASTYNTVGKGTVTGAPSATNGPEDKADGKPRVLYVGAEYCPYCAMERWALVSALSRFGTWSGLSGAVSSPNEGSLSNIQTVTFKGASYKSDYLSFKGWETKDRLGNTIETMTDADTALFSKYNPQGSIPFILYGGKAATVGATFDGSSMPGMTNTEIINEIRNPSTSLSKGALGASNTISAELCTLTGNQPANVCNSSGVKAAAANLTAAK